MNLPSAPQRPAHAYLGFDPGRSGAAALLDGSGALTALVGWKPVTRRGARRYEVKSWRHREAQPAFVEIVLVPYRSGSVGSRVVATLAHGAQGDTLVACEDSYVGKNPKTSLTLARFSGGVVAPAEELFSRAAQWVLPGEWRAAILGLPRNTRRAGAKAASLRYMPMRIPRLADALRRLGAADHYTDAAGIAEWLRTTPR